MTAVLEVDGLRKSFAGAAASRWDILTLRRASRLPA